VRRYGRPHASKQRQCPTVALDRVRLCPCQRAEPAGWTTHVGRRIAIGTHSQNRLSQLFRCACSVKVLVTQKDLVTGPHADPVEGPQRAPLRSGFVPLLKQVACLSHWARMTRPLGTPGTGQQPSAMPRRLYEQYFSNRLRARNPSHALVHRTLVQLPSRSRRDPRQRREILSMNLQLGTLEQTAIWLCAAHSVSVFSRKGPYIFKTFPP